MPTYLVTRKSDGAEVYRYTSDSPIPWNGMEFETHDHTALSDQPDPTPTPTVDPARWRIYVGSFFDRFGEHKIGILASTDPLVQAVIKDASVRRYIDLHGRRAELAQAIGLLQMKGFAVDPVAILDVEPDDEEVWRG